MKYKVKSFGFSLVEMMVVIAITGIITAAATPAFRAIFLKNTTIAYTNDFKLALYLAQNEAVKRNIRVTLKPSSASNSIWEGGWNIFQDNDEDGLHDSNEETIYSYVPSANNYTLKSKIAAYANDFAFNSLGEPVTHLGSASNGEFTLCDPDNNGLLSRIVKISFSGNITVSEGDSTTCD